MCACVCVCVCTCLDVGDGAMIAQELTSWDHVQKTVLQINNVCVSGVCGVCVCVCMCVCVCVCVGCVCAWIDARVVGSRT